MQQPSALLEQQHRMIDAGIVDVADGGGSLPALGESLALLRLHLYMEEQLLFPPLEKSGLTMPVFVMKREHGQMWSLLLSLAAACEAGQPVDGLREDCQRLLQLLQAHNPKEEMIVYAAADRLAARDDDGRFVATLAAAELPEDWSCQMAPKAGQPAI